MPNYLMTPDGVQIIQQFRIFRKINIGQDPDNLSEILVSGDGATESGNIINQTFHTLRLPENAVQFPEFMDITVQLLRCPAYLNTAPDKTEHISEKKCGYAKGNPWHTVSPPDIIPRHCIGF